MFRQLSVVPGHALAAAVLSALVLVSGCGREAPTLPPDPPDSPVVPPGAPDTRLSVAADPAGAAILLDGVDTGEVTPFEFTGLPVGEIAVSLQVPGYLVAPSSFTANLAEGVPVEVPVGTFTTRSRRLVMLEGFAAVNCPPCPQLTTNLLNLTSQEGYGSDRVAFVEYATWWFGPDPFYLNATDANDERLDFYGPPGAPSLLVDGNPQESALDFEAMRDAVDAALGTDPGLLVDVTADLAADPVTVVVTITALRDVDLSGHVVYAAVYQEEIQIVPAPGTNGQTEFHHMLLGSAIHTPLVTSLSAGMMGEIHLSVTATTGAWDPGTLAAYAFLQRTDDQRIIQAGSTSATAAAAASLFVGSAPTTRSTPEGIQP